MARWDANEEPEPWERASVLRCWHEPCSRVWQRLERTGPVPRYCSDACKQKNHRLTRPMSKTAKGKHLRAQKARAADWETFEAADWLWAAQEARRQREEQERTRRAYEQFQEDTSWWRSRAGGSAWSAFVPGQDQRTARDTVFRFAQLDDDGTVPLQRAFRAASRRCHPDLGGDRDDFEALVKARELLESAAAWS